MIEAGDLFAAARAMLERVEATAATMEYTLPGRRYTTVGGSVYDCEQVTVSVMSSAVGIVSAEGTGGLVGPCDPTWNVTYEIAIVRKAHEANEGPRGQLVPTVEKIEADASGMSSAYAVLVNAIEAVSSDAIGVGRVTGSVQFGQPQGGLVAAVATVTANLWV